MVYDNSYFGTSAREVADRVLGREPLEPTSGEGDEE
jgi:hypothetical protein